MRRILPTLAVLALTAATSFAQKGPADELGFHADKLYDFTNVDAVNLFNGNLTISVPIGMRYQVSPTLSYQFMAVYNGKVWDDETWTCQDPRTGVFTECSKTYPNLRSNAGLGWRVSLGRLLPPYDPGLQNDTLTDISWVYEGPAGDEHALGESSTSPLQTNVHDHMRMRLNPDGTRDVEFASGEVHHFVLENSVWRLKQMRDRFFNHVDISYIYSSDGKRELQWNITDTVGRTQYVVFTNYPAMADGWSRGQNVLYLDLQAFNGARASYSFGYTPYSNSSSCYFSALPALTSIELPDGTMYQFAYNSFTSSVCSLLGTLSTVTYPTGGTVSYTMGDYALLPQTTICNTADTAGIASRTIRDGTTVREWDYLQSKGPLVPVTHPINDPCNTGLNPPSWYSPVYWSRTSVVAPVDATGHRTRTDNYFSIFADQADGYVVDNPFSGLPLTVYSHSGTAGVPPPDIRKQLGIEYTYDVDAADDPANPQRLLATEVYEGCAADGNCANGRLMRSTYDRHEGFVTPNRPYGHPIDDVRLVTSRTVYEDDANCNGKCYTQVTYSNDNGNEQFRTTTHETNFPIGVQSVSETTQYRTWSSSDLVNGGIPWVLNTFTEKTRTENGTTSTEKFCFDDYTGALSRHRVLAGSSLGANDILHVYSYDSHGDLQFASDYGGDVQSLDTGADLCSIPLPGQAWYKVDNSYLTREPDGLDHYTGGVLTTSRYYDRTTGSALGFFSTDRTVDRWTGVVTAARDSAGVATAIDYDPVPSRIHSMTSPTGAVTTYTYTNATGSILSTWTPPKVDVVTTAGTDSINAQYVYDGIGRVQREAHRGVNEWFATETSFDEAGRVGWKSTPESTGSNPPAGPLTAAHKTSYAYDALGRTTAVTTPDNKMTSFAYAGVRQRRTTASVATASGEVPVTTSETYDQSGRLLMVTEAEGTASQVTTNYGYDGGGRLSSVSMAGTQSRNFVYDLRGFLNWEQHPEIGINGGGTMRYGSYDPRGHAGETIRGLSNELFDLTFTYDSAERLVAVDDHGAAHRPLKRFTFATFNDGADLRNGKLLQATRYNHLTTGDFTVTETYKYANSLGRPSERATVVQTSAGTTVESFNQNFSYDSFGAVGQLDYPICQDPAPCSGALPGPVPYVRSKGFLVGVSPYAPLITYNPDSSVHQVVHGTSSQITDSYEPDASGMTRPGLITFSGFQVCTAPTANVSGGGTIPPGGSVQIQATLTGTAPWSVVWSDGYAQPGVTASSITRTVNPSVTTTYTIVSISDANCSGTSSGYATVTVSCNGPTATVSGGGTVTPGNFAQIQVTFTGTSPWTITWSDGLQQSGITTSTWTRTVTPASTTTYTITSVRDANCAGTSSGSATVTVSLNAPTGLVATTNTGDTLHVSVHWNGVSGAGWYQVERATNINGAYTPVGGHLTTTSFTDGFAATAPATYLYRVRAGATFSGVDTTSNPSNLDYATVATTLFTDDPVSAGSTIIRGAHIAQLRQAIDAVRAAAGLAQAWGSYAPLTGTVFAADNTTARQRLDEAVVILVGHGVSYSGETPAATGIVRAYQVQQIREGVK